MQSNQGFYKFKKIVRPNIFQNGLITDKYVKLSENTDGYSYVMSEPGDMIISTGRNVIDVSNIGYNLVRPAYEIHTSVDDSGVVTVDTNGTFKTSNGAMTDKAITIDIKQPCRVWFSAHHISGTIMAEKSDVPRDTGFRLGKLRADGSSMMFSYSQIPLLSEQNSINNAYVDVTEEDIADGIAQISLVLWSNGSTADLGGMKFTDYKYTIMAQITDAETESEINSAYEQFKRITKVCDNNGHCYINTWKSGNVYSQNGNEITVDFPKSEFTMKFRSIVDRVQNLDAADTNYENRRILFFGDSITAGFGATQIYHMWLSRYTGMKCLNYGVSSTGYVVTTSATGITGTGQEGRGETQERKGNNTILQVMTSIGDFENCFIFAGVNDFNSNVNIATFRTAVQNALNYAQTKASRIFVMTPVRCPGFDTPNSSGKTLHDYSDVVIEECKSRGIPVVDGFDIPMNPDNTQSKEWYYSAGDGLHPSNRGHKLMSGWMLDKFKAVFKV